MQKCIILSKTVYKYSQCTPFPQPIKYSTNTPLVKLPLMIISKKLLSKVSLRGTFTEHHVKEKLAKRVDKKLGSEIGNSQTLMFRASTISSS